MTLPIEVHHHATMLSDTMRLDQYREAIQELVTKNDSVVEIGCGTGILLSYIAEQTDQVITGIEYFDKTAQCAQALCEQAGYEQVEINNKSSYQTQLHNHPTVLVTETIGSFGPEENIVELTHDFIKRHPSIKTIIPATLSLYIQEFISEPIAQQKEQFINRFLSCEHKRFNYKILENPLSDYYHQQIHVGRFNLSDECNIVLLGKPQLVVDYQLGKSSTANFQKKLTLKNDRSDGVLFYFVAQLSPEIKLSNHPCEQMTHWQHPYIARPKQSKSLIVSYDSEVKIFCIDWA